MSYSLFTLTARQVQWPLILFSANTGQTAIEKGTYLRIGRVAYGGRTEGRVLWRASERRGDRTLFLRILWTERDAAGGQQPKFRHAGNAQFADQIPEMRIHGADTQSHGAGDLLA